jgi:hypothetical protein
VPPPLWLPWRRYSERLLLVPGMGIVFDPNMPYPRLGRPMQYRGRLLGIPRPDDELIINCAWSAPKINIEALVTFRRLLDRLHAAHAYVGTPRVRPSARLSLVHLCRRPRLPP